jgi:hypothetical protein
MMNEQKIKPSKWFYLIGIAIIIGGALISAGIIIYCVFTWASVATISPSVLSGKNEITLSSGAYTLYYDYNRSIGNIEFSDIPELQCSLVYKKTGEQIGFISAANESSYSIIGRSGKSLYNFKIKQDGQYEFTGSFNRQLSKEHQAALTIGEDRGSARFLHLFILTSIIELVSVISGLTIIIVTFVKRRKANVAW